MKKLLLITLLLLFASTRPVSAVYNPLSVANNKFGIHIVDENDLENAALLVNSNGGDWGYATIVIRQDDRNIEKWQKIFDRMKELHLIPLLRIATVMQNDFWATPKLNEAFPWSDFLNMLEWPIKNKYVILFNEPNHAKEWGGIIDPTGYANIVASYSAALKSRSEDFYILPAGLDASAPNSKDTISEENFLNQMLEANLRIFDYLDGWTSHSYPNPGFGGNTKDHGRGTIRTFFWEVDLLSKKNISKFMPIFITETGWPHRDGVPNDHNYLTPEEVAENIKKSASTIWNDSNIVAITPFILNYQSYPFSNFSWQKYNSGDFYPQFYVYQSIPKIKGEPIQNINYSEQKVLALENIRSDTQSATNNKVDIKKNISSGIFSLLLSLVQLNKSRYISESGKKGNICQMFII